MKRIAGVRFHKGGRIYFFDCFSLDVNKGDMVLVSTSFGEEAGEVLEIEEKSDKEIKRELMPVIKILKKEEVDFLKKKERDKKKYIEIANCIVELNGLNMKIMDVNFNIDDTKVTFVFSSESRIDFRQLVRDLNSKLKKQVVLRQIGPRDEARLLGGYGRCGREYCCKGFLQNLESITMDMAKVQNLAGKGSSKISGACGKLMCCLSYEVNVYKDLVKNLPGVGEKIKTKKGNGVVIDQNIIKQTVLVELEKDRARMEVSYGEEKEKAEKEE